MSDDEYECAPPVSLHPARRAWNDAIGAVLGRIWIRGLILGLAAPRLLLDRRR